MIFVTNQHVWEVNHRILKNIYTSMEKRLLGLIQTPETLIKIRMQKKVYSITSTAYVSPLLNAHVILIH